MVAMVNASEPVRLVLIDDDPLVRAGLKMLLGADPSLRIVGEGADGDEAVGLVETHRPDLVLMDIRMPRLDGLSATERLLARPGAPRIIILTTFDSDDMVLRALAAGAAGFLLKDTAPEAMIEAIHRVAEGEHMLSPSIIAQVIEVATRSLADRTHHSFADLEELNEREKQVAIAIGRGLTNAQIASSQYISIATVKATVTKVLEKLCLTNRVQIAIKVHDAGWLT